MSVAHFEDLVSRYPESRSNSPTQWVSERFCAGDSDVTFRSSDGCLFRIHRKNLETHTGGFPPPGFETRGEIVDLMETSSTLDLLFQFIYPSRHPDLEFTPFEKLSPLAEAAEKYEVYAAINVCKIWMRNTLPAFPKEIFVYAARHDYSDVMDKAAPLLLSIPPDKLVTTLPSDLVVPWILYYQSWVGILQDAIAYPRTTPLETYERSYTSFYNVLGTNISQMVKSCRSCSFNIDVVVAEITGKLDNVDSLRELDFLFDLKSKVCAHVHPKFLSWRSYIESRIMQVSPFAAHLSTH